MKHQIMTVMLDAEKLIIVLTEIVTTQLDAEKLIIAFLQKLRGECINN